MHLSQVVLLSLVSCIFAKPQTVVQKSDELSRRISSNEISQCLEEKSITRVVDAIIPALTECAFSTDDESSLLLQRVWDSLSIFNLDVSGLYDVAQVCYNEPGIGETINCVLEKIDDIQPVFLKMLSSMSSSIVHATAAISSNLRVTRICLDFATKRALRDLNEAVEQARACVVD